jgi:para-aminobenzoate synthetase component I
MKSMPFENCVFFPSPAAPNKGRLYQLGEKGEYQKNSFVLIPYQNPQTAPVQPAYYPVLSVHEHVFELQPEPKDQQKLLLQARLSHSDYLEKIKALHSEIQYGNIYEINFCMDFFAEQVLIDPVHTFIRLQERAKAPYAALVKLGADFILCASPELFLEKKGNSLISKPIKGTAARGKDREEDEAKRLELQQSLKQRTENVMAVDVARNDFSVFAKRASVKVDRLFAIESFETVHQMVSTVSCVLKEGTNFEDIIAATFPMASMTGAPKLMAMKLIDKFENFERRNYSGSFGLIDADGDFILNVVIRSVFYNSQHQFLSLAVGGAITYLSEAEEEYRECLLKAENMFKVLSYL